MDGETLNKLENEKKQGFNQKDDQNDQEEESRRSKSTLFDVAPQQDLDKLSEAVNRLDDQVVTPDVKYSRLSTKPSNPNIMREIPINFANIPQIIRTASEGMLRYSLWISSEREMVMFYL